MRRRTVITVLALVLTLAGGVSALRAKNGSGPSPKIEVIDVKYDFGRVFEGEKYEHTFTVRNRGGADLVIDDVKPG